MTRREVGVLPPRRRGALLETAAAEFADAGYERASLNRIIRACGMSKSSFYHYFDSKEALFNAVITDLGQAMMAGLTPPTPAELADGDFWSHFEALADRLATLAETDGTAAHLSRLFYLPDAPKTPGSPIAEATAAVDDWIDRALEIGRSKGAVGDDLPPSLQSHLFRTVLWAMDEWSVEHLRGLAPEETRNLSTAQLRALRRLLSP